MRFCTRWLAALPATPFPAAWGQPTAPDYSARILTPPVGHAANQRRPLFRRAHLRTAAIHDSGPTLNISYP